MYTRLNNSGVEDIKHVYEIRILYQFFSRAEKARDFLCMWVFWKFLFRLFRGLGYLLWNSIMSFASYYLVEKMDSFLEIKRCNGISVGLAI